MPDALGNLLDSKETFDLLRMAIRIHHPGSLVAEKIDAHIRMVVSEHDREGKKRVLDRGGVALPTEHIAAERERVISKALRRIANTVDTSTTSAWLAEHTFNAAIDFAGSRYESLLNYCRLEPREVDMLRISELELERDELQRELAEARSRVSKIPDAKRTFAIETIRDYHDFVISEKGAAAIVDLVFAIVEDELIAEGAST